MIDKNVIKKIRDLKIEYDDLDDRLKREESKAIIDGVKGSSSEFPYTAHTCKIEGFPNDKKIKRYRKMIGNKKREIGEKLLSFEYQLNGVKDSEIRTLLRLKYIDGLTNNQIAHKLNEKGDKDYTEDGVRMKINRFFKKNI